MPNHFYHKRTDQQRIQSNCFTEKYQLMANIENFRYWGRDKVEVAKQKTMNKRDDTLHLPIACKMSLPTPTEQV